MTGRQMIPNRTDDWFLYHPKILFQNKDVMQHRWQNDCKLWGDEMEGSGLFKATIWAFSLIEKKTQKLLDSLPQNWDFNPRSQQECKVLKHNVVCLVWRGDKPEGRRSRASSKRCRGGEKREEDSCYCHCYSQAYVLTKRTWIRWKMTNDC